MKYFRSGFAYVKRQIRLSAVLVDVMLAILIHLVVTIAM